jgi:hypothetical protein
MSCAQTFPIVLFVKPPGSVAPGVESVLGRLMAVLRPPRTPRPAPAPGSEAGNVFGGYGSATQMIGSRGPVVRCADGSHGFQQECASRGGTASAGGGFDAGAVFQNFPAINLGCPSVEPQVTPTDVPGWYRVAASGPFSYEATLRGKLHAAGWEVSSTAPVVAKQSTPKGRGDGAKIAGALAAGGVLALLLRRRA